MQIEFEPRNEHTHIGDACAQRQNLNSGRLRPVFHVRNSVHFSVRGKFMQVHLLTSISIPHFRACVIVLHAEMSLSERLFHVQDVHVDMMRMHMALLNTWIWFCCCFSVVTASGIAWIECDRSSGQFGLIDGNAETYTCKYLLLQEAGTHGAPGNRTRSMPWRELCDSACRIRSTWEQIFSLVEMHTKMCAWNRTHGNRTSGVSIVLLLMIVLYLLCCILDELCLSLIVPTTSSLGSQWSIFLCEVFTSPSTITWLQQIYTVKHNHIN